MNAMDAERFDVEFPAGYESEAWTWESKGYIVVGIATRTRPQRRYKVTVRDPVRLQQDVETELGAGQTLFQEANSVVVARVDKRSIEAAVRELASQGFASLKAEPAPDQGEGRDPGEPSIEPDPQGLS